MRIERLLCNRTRFDQLLITLQVQFRVCEYSLVMAQRTLCLQQLRVERPRIDACNHLSFPDRLPLAEIDGTQYPVDLRDDRDGTRRCHGAE
ncbi:hypothetical protein [Paraburkholderia sp. BL6669N2]|uniref:hypothetical protein n=1 Tax=Paraburkholderia sp. BL6669N2 TaxID=1938807 RepID=UPI001C6F45B9|nr:hypothetical protein [Paraburkholderia sp. BL6669N2]